MNVFGIGVGSLNVAERSLDFVTKSTKLTSANIANAETPNYKGKRLDFEAEMSKALNNERDLNPFSGGVAKTDPRHFPITDLSKVKPSLAESDRKETINGNTVSLDEEMVRLKELEIKYGAYTTIANKELGKLRNAISLSVK